MIADMLSNKKLNPVVTELFIRGRKLNIFLFLSHNLILLFQKILIPNKQEFKQIVSQNSSDIDFQESLSRTLSLQQMHGKTIFFFGY